MTKTFCDRCGREFDNSDSPIWKYWRDLKPGELGIEIHKALKYEGGEVAVPPMELCQDCYNKALNAVLPIFGDAQGN